MKDTTGLDVSRAENCTLLLISKASSLHSSAAILASFSKLNLTLCMPSLLVVVVVVVCFLVLVLTGSYSNVFSAIFNKYPCIVDDFICECPIAKGLDYCLSWVV